MSLMRFARTLQNANANAAAPSSSIRVWSVRGFQFQSVTDDNSDSQWRSRFAVRHVSSTPTTMKLREKSKLRPGKRSMKRDVGDRGRITSEKSNRTTQIHQLKRKIKDLSEGVQPLIVKDKLISLQHAKPKKFTQGPFSAFVSCLPGLEPLLLQEVQYLLAATQQSKPPVSLAVPGGVKVIVPTLAHLYVLHLYLGTASHIYLRLNDDGIGSSAGIPPLFRARGFPELQRKLKDMILSQRWDTLLNVPRPNIGETRSVGSLPWQLHVHVTTSKSKLMHTKAVEERVRQTIGEALGIEGLEGSGITTKDSIRSAADKNTGDKPVVRLLVRIVRDEVQLSLDTSSSSSATPLHMRGYRLNPHKAPLREDLAYALLMVGGLKPNWNLRPLQFFFGAVDSDPDTFDAGVEPEVTSRISEIQLFDPLCGSGTLAVEAASILAGLPPGRFRQPPFLGTKLCDLRLWDDMNKALFEAANKSKGDSFLVAANDINKEAIAAAKSNSKRAGVSELIDFSVGSFKIHPLMNQSRKSAISVPRSQPLVVVTNPPYGHRLPTNDSQSSIYKQIANALKSIPCKVKFTMIGNDPRGLRESSLPLKVAFSTKHGGMNVVAMSGFMNN